MLKCNLAVNRLLLTLTTVCLLPSPTLLHAQAVAIAEVSGIITDQSGSTVGGAMVDHDSNGKATRPHHGYRSGRRYVLPNLAIWPVSALGTGQRIKDYIQSGIVLQVGNNVQLNVSLQVGWVNETVEVQAAAAMVETSQTGVAQVIDARRIIDLPLNGGRRLNWCCFPALRCRLRPAA